MKTTEQLLEKAITLLSELTEQIEEDYPSEQWGKHFKSAFHAAEDFIRYLPVEETDDLCN